MNIRRDPSEIFEGIASPSAVGLGLEERIHFSLPSRTRKSRSKKYFSYERRLVLPSPFIVVAIINVSFFPERSEGSCGFWINPFAPSDQELSRTSEVEPLDRKRSLTWPSVYYER